MEVVSNLLRLIFDMVRNGNTKVIIEKSRSALQWEIFMEQELRFGPDLGRMANFPAFIASKSFDLKNVSIICGTF